MRSGRGPATTNDAAPTLFDSAGGPPLPWEWAVEAVTLRLSFPFVVAPEDPRSKQALVYPDRQRKPPEGLGQPQLAEHRPPATRRSSATSLLAMS